MDPGICSLSAVDGAPRSVDANEHMRAASPRDVIFHVGETPLEPRTISALTRAAEDSTVATVSPFPGVASVQAHGRTRLRVPAPNQNCVLVRRSAYDLIGPLREDYPWPEALAIFGAECTARGLAHVLAPESARVAEGFAFAGDDRGDAEASEFEEADSDPASASVRWARAKRQRVQVAIDARSLGGEILTGTQIHLLELTRALADRPDLEVTAIVPDDPHDLAAKALDGLDVRWAPFAAVAAGDVTVSADVVHRPNQVTTLDDLRLLRLVSSRLVITQQDNLLFHNPSYFGSTDEWRAFRRVTRMALAQADRVVFFSDHARREAELDGLLAHGRSDVVPIGVDHAATSHAVPEPVDELRGSIGDSLVCLGTNLLHKNRPFALRIARELRALGWGGELVFAGPHLVHGTSEAEERTEDAPWVRDLGPVTEGQKAWLLSKAGVVLYPTTIEGFGLVPFEAAAAGTPCAFAPQAALAEVLPGQATLVPWNARVSAHAVHRLLQDADVARSHVRAITERALSFRWDQTAERLASVYESLLSEPRPQAALLLDEALRRQASLEEAVAAHDRWVAAYQEVVARFEAHEKVHAEVAQAYGDVNEALERVAREHDAFVADIGSDGARLVSASHGVLPPEIQRALLALATRPALRRPVFALLRLLYAMGRRLT